MKVNTAVLVWARERLGLTVDQVATLVKSESYESWEDGVSSPTYRQAIDLASRLRIPFGYLFLSKPPRRSLGLPDLRTVKVSPPRSASPNLWEVVQDALRKQHWLAEEVQAEGQPKRSFVGKFSVTSDVAEVAASIRRELQINEETRAETSTYQAFLSSIVRNAESAGIIVLRSGMVCGNTHRTLDVSEFRGFAMVNPFAPLVFINTRDAVGAQIFTFAHEIAHIWIGESGISNLDFYKKSAKQVNQVESVCNAIAAEVLVPAAGFARSWNEKLSDSDNLAKLRRYYRVSEMVVLRKAFDDDLISATSFHAGLEKYFEIPLAERLNKSESKPAGGDYYNSLYARNSSMFTASVVQAYSSGKMLISEACNLLGVKGGVLNRLVTAN